MRIKLLPYFLLQRCSAVTPLDLDGIDEVLYTKAQKKWIEGQNSPGARGAATLDTGFNRWTLSQKGNLSVNLNNGLSPAAGAHLRIPYRFSTNAANSETFDIDQKKIIKDSLADISFWLKGCIEFYDDSDRTRNYNDYILFTNEQGASYCGSSYVGKVVNEMDSESKSFQRIWLNCIERRTIQHEMYHALGFHHEHTRGDRDDYIIIHSSLVNNVNYMKISGWWDTNRTYDYDSIMHYSGVGGSIVRKDNGADVWPRSYDWNSRRATSQDIIEMAMMYNQFCTIPKNYPCEDNENVFLFGRQLDGFSDCSDHSDESLRYFYSVHEIPDEAYKCGRLLNISLIADFEHTSYNLSHEFIPTDINKYIALNENDKISAELQAVTEFNSLSFSTPIWVLKEYDLTSANQYQNVKSVSFGNSRVEENKTSIGCPQDFGLDKTWWILLKNFSASITDFDGLFNGTGVQVTEITFESDYEPQIDEISSTERCKFSESVDENCLKKESRKIEKLNRERCANRCSELEWCYSAEHHLPFSKSGNGVFQACYLFESRNEATVCPRNLDDVSQIVCPTDKMETPLWKISQKIVLFAVIILAIISTTVKIIRQRKQSND